MASPEFAAQLAQYRRQVRGFRREQTEEELEDANAQAVIDDNVGFGGYVQDAVRGIGRGVFGAATLGLLPDEEDELFGRTRTTLGSVTEGIVQFASWFVPVAGLLGRGVAGARALSRTAQAGRATAAGRFGTEIARNTVAGAVADFAAFEGHEQRLSNLLQEHEFLANPVSDFLAADEDDSEVEGRLKNALEGAALGNAIDFFVAGLRGVRTYRKARAAGATPQAARDAAEEAVGPEVRDLAEQAKSEQQTADGALQDQVDELAEDPRHEFTNLRTTTPDGRPIHSLRLRGEEILVARGTDGVYRQIGSEVDLGRSLREAQDSLAFDRLGPDEKKFAAPLLDSTDDIADRIKRTDAADPEGSESALNPRDPLVRAAGELEKEQLNLTGMPGSEANVSRAIEDVLHKAVPEKGYQPNEDFIRKSVQEAADLAGLSEQEYLVRVSGDVESSYDLMVRTLAHRILYRRSLEELREQAVAGLASSDALARAQFIETLTKTAHRFRAVAGLTANQGRALQQNRIPFLKPDELEGLIREAGGGKNVDRVMQQFIAAMDAGGAEAARKVLDAGFGSKVFGILNEYWVNSILSSPRTWAVNGIANGLLTVYQPMERLVGAIVTGQSNEIRGAMMEIAGLRHTFVESIGAAKIGFDTGADPLTGAAGKATEVGVRERAITSANLGVRADGPAGNAIDWFAENVIRLSGKVLQATDSYFKQVNYRTIVRRRLTERALRDGVDPSAVAARVNDQMERMIVNFQAFSEQTLVERGRAEAARVLGADASPEAVETFALRWARNNFDPDESILFAQASEEGVRRAEETTFTAPLRSGPDAPRLEDLTSRFSDAVTAHPYLRPFAPFIRTPFNIAKYAVQRSAGLVIGGAEFLVHYLGNRGDFGATLSALNGSRNRLLQDLTAVGPDAATRKADAAGRVSAAIAGVTFFNGLMEGAIPGLEHVELTGRGPEDPDQRRLLQAAGWLPYSFKIGRGENAQYIQYQRLDPFASLLGVLADYHTLARWLPPDDQQSIDDIGTMVLVAVAENFTNKTYLEGLANLTAALQDPERKIPRLFQRYFGGFVPRGPAELASFAATGGDRGVDPLLREVRTITDALMSKIPFYSDRIDPQRNFLGEPVKRMKSLGPHVTDQINGMFMPIAYSHVESDKLVAQEIAKLNRTFRTPRAVPGGVDLREFRNERGQSAYDRQLELRSEVTVGGKTLRVALRELFRNPEYQRLPAESTLEFDSPRVGLINRIVSRYARVAELQMRREFPDVHAALLSQRRNKQAAFR